MTLFQVGGANVSLYRVVLFFVFIGIVLTLLVEKGQKLKWNQLLHPLMAAIIINFLIAILNGSDVLHVSHTKSRIPRDLLGYTSCFLLPLFFYERKYVARFITSYILAAAIPCTFAIYQVFYFLQTGTFPGFLFLTTEDIGWGNITLQGTFPRAGSTFSEPNFAGLFAAIVVVLSLSRMLFYRERKRLMRIATFLIFFIALFALIGSLSRTAWLGALTSFLIIAAIRTIKTGNLLFVFKSLTAAFVLIGGLFIASNVFMDGYGNELVERRIQQDNPIQNTGNIYGREKNIKEAFTAFSQNPIQGMGFGGIIRVAKTRSISTGHSLYMTILGEYGFIGVILYTLFFGLILFMLYNRISIKKKYGYLDIGLLLALITVMIANLGYDSAFNFDASWLVIILSIMAANSLHRESVTPQR